MGTRGRRVSTTIQTTAPEGIKSSLTSEGSTVPQVVLDVIKSQQETIEQLEDRIDELEDQRAEDRRQRAEDRQQITAVEDKLDELGSGSSDDESHTSDG